MNDAVNLCTTGVAAAAAEWAAPSAVEWQPLHMAPRDRPVLLFLPTATYTQTADGRPQGVQSAEVVGVWDEARQRWVNRDTGELVYPSQWAEL
jgi:hypothetical protein